MISKADQLRWVKPKRKKKTPKHVKRAREWAKLKKTLPSGLCEDCKKVPWVDAHHIKLKSQGGTDDLDNIALLCRDCHEARHGIGERK